LCLWLGEEKVICAKMIEELKTKHKIEIDSQTTLVKQNADENQELMQIVAEHKQQFEKAKECVQLKNNIVRLYFELIYFVICNLI